MGATGSGWENPLAPEKLQQAESAIQSWFKSPAEEAARKKAEMQTEMYAQVQPTLSKIFAGELPEGVVSRVTGYGEDIANKQAETLAGKFQQAGMAFTPTHAGAEADIRTDVARQTQESLADLQFRMQSAALGQVLGMQTEEGVPGWMQGLYGVGELASIFGV